MTFLLPLLLAAILRTAEIETSDVSCGSSTDRIVHAEILEPTEDAIRAAIQPWIEAVDAGDLPGCFTVVISPIEGADGAPIILPILIVFERAEPAPEAETPWIKQQKGQVA